MARIRVPRKGVTQAEVAAVLSRRLGGGYQVEPDGEPDDGPRDLITDMATVESAQPTGGGGERRLNPAAGQDHYCDQQRPRSFGEIPEPIGPNESMCSSPERCPSSCAAIVAVMLI